MLAVREVAGLVDDVHLGAALAPGHELHQAHALVQRGGGVVVAPHQQGGPLKAAVADPAQGLLLLPRVGGQEEVGLEPLDLHLLHRLLVLGQLADGHAGVEPVIGNVVVAVGIALVHPALAFPPQARVRRVGEHDVVASDAGRQGVGVHRDHGLDQVGPFQGHARHQVGAAGMPHQVDVAELQGLQETQGMPHHRGHGVVVVALGIVGQPLAQLVHRVDVEPLRQAVEVEPPVEAAVGRVVGAEIAAVEQHQRLAAALLEVTGADAVHVHELFVCLVHVSPP